jgi:hypothetical protein
MADFIFLIFLPPVLLCMYYVGFITLTKLNIKQPDKTIKTHILRFFYGFAVLFILALLVFLMK